MIILPTTRSVLSSAPRPVLPATAIRTGYLSGGAGNPWLLQFHGNGVQVGDLMVIWPFAITNTSTVFSGWNIDATGSVQIISKVLTQADLEASAANFYSLTQSNDYWFVPWVVYRGPTSAVKRSFLSSATQGATPPALTPASRSSKICVQINTAGNGFSVSGGTGVTARVPKAFYGINNVNAFAVYDANPADWAPNKFAVSGHGGTVWFNTVELLG